MFRISTKGDYGLLLLSTLAEKNKGEFVSLKEIAREKKLSFHYLSQIIIPLKNAGIVESREGLRGGYRLAKKPHEINIMDILEILEGECSPVRCCGSGREERQGTCEACKSEEVCNVKHIWRDASSLMADFLRNKTLADTVSHPAAKTPNVTFIQ